MSPAELFESLLPKRSKGTPVPCNLRAIRKARSMKLQNVANITGLSLGFISQIELGQNEPGYGTIQKMVKLFGVPAEQIWPELSPMEQSDGKETAQKT